MNLLLLLVFPFFLALSTFEQEKLREVDLRVNGIGSGSSYSAVVRKLGEPLRSETQKLKAYEACSNSAETHLTLFYSGLEIKLLGDGAGRNLEVYSIEVTGTKWTASGVSIGTSEKNVPAKFGKPISKEEKSGETIFFYVTKDNLGGVNFYFRNNRLIKMAMTETLC